MRHSFLFLILSLIFLSCGKEKDPNPEVSCQLVKFKDQNGKLLEEFIYNSDNLLTKVISTSGGSVEKPGNVIEITYNGNGKAIQGLRNYTDPGMSQEVYTYNPDGFLIKTKTTYSTNLFEYNSNNQVVKSAYYAKRLASDPETLFEENEYEYNNNNVVKVNTRSFYRGTSQTDTVFSTSLYEYDANKNPFSVFRIIGNTGIAFSVNNPLKASITNTRPDSTVIDKINIVYSYSFNNEKLPTQITGTETKNGTTRSYLVNLEYSCQ